MKYILSQMAFFLTKTSNRRNVNFMLRFVLLAVFLILVYSVLFHYIMMMEDRYYSPVTGLYWALTVMSTLGFGDITFQSDTGKIFTVVVLLTGILLFMLVMPFTFIRFIYSPWLEAKTSAITPRELPKTAHGHIIIVGEASAALNIADKCRHYSYPYALLVEDSKEALTLFDKRYNIVLGAVDTFESYAAMRAEKASLVLALHDDLKNTNIASTVREYDQKVLIAGMANSEASAEILRLAGCNSVFNFAHLLGESMARRILSSAKGSNIIGRFEGFCIAECAAHGTELMGKKLSEIHLRKRFGLNVVGIWQGNQYMAARPDTIIDDGAVILLAGTADMLEKYDKFISPKNNSEESPVLILGGGRVGSAVAETLTQRKIPYRIVEQKQAIIPRNDDRYIVGNAAEISTLKTAGITETHSVIVTTHNDDLNIYLTIYCRKLRPDIQIISRATYDRNVASLYNGGANLVMSQASLMANTVINLLVPGKIFMLTEGLNIFSAVAPASLIGLSLIDSNIRKDTDCNIIAVRHKGVAQVPPDPNGLISEGDELVLVGDAEAEKYFIDKYFH